MQPEKTQFPAGAQTRSVDAGLQAHMQRIYNRMAVGVLVTAITAFFVLTTPALMQLLLGGPQMYIFMFAPLAIVWFGFNPMKMAPTTLRLSFFAICVLYGISFSVIFLAYTGESIFRAFFLASAMFAGLSIFGYTTKKNLSGLMSFCVMGVIGVLVMGLANAFIFKSPMLADMVSVIGILAFAGITAWQTQAMKEMYSPAHGEDANSRMGWSAALTLYISFIAIFMHLLQLFGNQR